MDDSYRDGCFDNTEAEVNAVCASGKPKSSSSQVGWGIHLGDGREYLILGRYTKVIARAQANGPARI
jgi:hypothetical protein